MCSQWDQYSYFEKITTKPRALAAHHSLSRSRSRRPLTPSALPVGYGERHQSTTRIIVKFILGQATMSLFANHLTLSVVVNEVFNNGSSDLFSCLAGTFTIGSSNEIGWTLGIRCSSLRPFRLRWRRCSIRSPPTSSSSLSVNDKIGWISLPFRT